MDQSKEASFVIWSSVESITLEFKVLVESASSKKNQKKKNKRKENATV